jgi:predicted amidohydrolase YtcJ
MNAKDAHDKEVARLRDNLIFAAKAFRAYTNAQAYVSGNDNDNGIIVAFGETHEDIARLVRE